MLRLERLVIQGFKSFKRKASIPFPTGFSCITGPNGSGKTNVLDAVCFVLGRRSSRTLRARKGQDLVFHGSKTKPAADFASVALYFNNSKRVLPVEDDSVSISRRINKKGVSTYRLNGKVVKREQVVDMLVLAGVHPDGHNIIQQGDVNQIVEMDPVERRQVIDGVAGISEYDEKKLKALKELAKIEERVKEAEIVLGEKQHVMDRLKSERDTALQYQKLENDLGKIRKSLILIEWTKSEKSLKEVNQKLAEKEKELEGLVRDIDGHDRRIAELEKRFESITQEVMKAKDRIEAATRAAQLRSDIQIKEERIEANRREIDRLQAMTQHLSTFSTQHSPAFQKLMESSGVFGSVSDLIKVPAQYAVATEVAAGSHMKDIIVDTMGTAVKCVNYLKRERVGRARFLPLDKIRPTSRSRFLPKEAIDWVSNLIKYEPKYANAMEYIFGTTACVKDIETAKAISRTQRMRMVTMDGDLVEASGAVTGGFYKKMSRMPQTKQYLKEVETFEAENRSLARELAGLRKELGLYEAKEKKSKQITTQQDQARIDVQLKKLREERKEAFERRLILQQETGKLNIRRAKLEASTENLAGLDDKVEKLDPEELKPFSDMSLILLNQKQKQTIEDIQALGPVNMKALKDFDALNEEFEDFREKVSKIIEEKKSIEDALSKIESKRLEAFMAVLNAVARNFGEVYSELTGGKASLALEDPNNIDTGLLIQASPARKKLLNIDAMSGGEKTLTAFAFLFAIQRHKPSPFYILDEPDATLDKTNTKRIVELIGRQALTAQFIVISHNDALVREADQVYGVSMEDGESKVFGVKLPRENA
ncbi:MAG: chromosome segregation SMC family protein [Candidatus Aenigmatarchaeota archaeon]